MLDGAMPSSDPDQLTDELNLVNAGYVADLYERYRADPSAVDDEWRARFDAGFAGFEPVAAAANGRSNGQPDAAPPASTAAKGGSAPAATPAASSAAAAGAPD